MRRFSCCRKQKGQALVEMVFMMILVLVIFVGFYEIGLSFYNISVIESAVKSAAWAASLGAPDSEIENILVNRTAALLDSWFMEAYPQNFYIEVWNDRDNIHLAPTAKATLLSPQKSTRAEYIFRAENYNIRLGVPYKVGFFLPFFGSTPLFTFDLTISSSFRIQTINDEDRDGMVDLYEPEYFVNIAGEAEDPDPGSAYWSPRSHTDSDVLIGNMNSDIDGDGILDKDEDYQNNIRMYANFDYNNDGIEDKLDFTNPGLIRNPLHTGVW